MFLRLLMVVAFVSFTLEQCKMTVAAPQTATRKANSETGIYWTL